MSSRAYHLERLNWRSANEQWLLLPGSDSVASFADRVEAESEARDREWDLRRRINPFTCGGPYLHYQTSFDAARLYDWCLDLGLEPPGLTFESSLWASWWNEQHPLMSDLHRAALWEALDRVRFFRVFDSTRSTPCHLVARPKQEEDPVQHAWNFRYVGCTPEMMSRSEATADHLCQELFVHRVASEGGYVGQLATPTSWLIPQSDPFGEVRDNREPQFAGDDYAERRPIELMAGREPTAGQTLYVVLRRHWRLEPQGDSWRWSPTESRSVGWPLVAFDTLAAADERMATLESEARQGDTPFRFGPVHEWSTENSSTLWGVLSDLAPIRFTSQWQDYKATDRLWCHWWDEVVPSLSQDDIRFVWSLFDRLRFYEIVSVEYRD